MRRAGRDMDETFVLLHALNNTEITNYFKYEPGLNSIFSRNNLPRIKHGVYVKNLNDKNSIGFHYWISLFIERNIAVYFDSLGMEYIPQEVLKKSKINQLLTIYLEYKITNLLYVDFIVLLS